MKKITTQSPNIKATGLLFDTNPQTMWIYDLETLQFLAVNDAAIANYGYSREEFLSMTLSDIRPQDDITKLHEDVANTTKSYNNAGIWRHLKKDGTLIYVQIISHEVVFRNRPARHVLVSDVTGLILKEQALIQSESNFRGLFEKNVAVMLIFDPTDGQVVEANESAARFYGYSVAELKQKRMTQINSLGEDCLPLMKKSLLEEQSYFVFVHKLKNGERRVVEVYSSKVIIDGRLCLHSIIHDVTEKKEAQKMLQLLNRAVEQSPTGIFITDTFGRIIYVNSRYCQITGYTSQELSGENPKLFKSGRMERSEYENLWNTILAGNIWRGELLNKRKNGDLYWEYAVIAPVSDDSGEITHFVAVKEDITTRKKMLEQLELSKAAAEEANRLKSAFLQNMSHELRTPLIAILGFAEILNEELEDSELRGMTEKIEYSANRLLETIKSILALSHAESKLLPVNTTVINVCAVAQDQFNIFREKAGVKGLGYNILLPEETIYALLDEEMFSRIIYHLLDNAIKFTMKGEVSLSIHTEMMITENGHELLEVKVRVADTGIGIAEEKIPLIFSAFRQVSEGYNRAFEGSGLGLTLSKMFAEKMGGRIDVRSTQNEGTVFDAVFTVRKQDYSLAEPVNTRKCSGSGLILLVEDEPVVFNIVQKMLGSTMVLELAGDAESALEMMKQRNYELVLLDINLGGGMSGLEAVNLIRRIPGYESTPVIACTVYTKGGDDDEYIRQGFDDILPKPFSRQTLNEKVSRWMNPEKN
ncbi:MAG: PAS domain S-box protein [Bacteroidetes bacterium]|nr:PAS domain S-box protein [Bacteroidota bacterium]